MEKWDWNYIGKLIKQTNKRTILFIKLKSHYLYIRSRIENVRLVCMSNLYLSLEMYKKTDKTPGEDP